MSRPTLDCIVRQLRRASDDCATTTDRELLDRYRHGGDQEAFAALVRRHGRLVLSACRQVLSDPADIDDAFQAAFLVLLRRARSMDWQQSLGGWLHAVAHRVAVHARAEGRRRRDRESRAMPPERGEAEAPVELSWREACAILHEELEALPERYRLPLLLCYLEGQSRDEAARNLGWTVGALRGLLERGRERLRRRLLRRGVGLSVGLLTAVAGSAVAGGPSTALVGLTVAAARGTPGTAQALAHAAFPTAKVANRTVAAILALAVALGAGLAVRHLLGAGEPPREPAKAELPEGKEQAPAARKAEATTLRGRVRSPDGKPLAGANLFLVGKPARFPGGELGTLRYKPASKDPKYPRYFGELGEVRTNYRMFGYHGVGGGLRPVPGNFGGECGHLR